MGVGRLFWTRGSKNFCELEPSGRHLFLSFSSSSTHSHLAETYSPVSCTWESSDPCDGCGPPGLEVEKHCIKDEKLPLQGAPPS